MVHIPKVYLSLGSPSTPQDGRSIWYSPTGGLPAHIIGHLWPVATASDESVLSDAFDEYNRLREEADALDRPAA